MKCHFDTIMRVISLTSRMKTIKNRIYIHEYIILIYLHTQTTHSLPACRVAADTNTFLF